MAFVPDTFSPPVGALAELKAAGAAGGDVAEFRRAINGYGVGDIDVVTNTRAIEVKAGNAVHTTNMTDFERQMAGVAGYAKDNGLRPTLSVPEGTVIHPARQAVLDKLGIERLEH